MAESEYSLEEVHSVIQHLNRGSPAQVGEANAYLMQFVETEDAWLCCLKLLRSEDNFVQYFAANMLLTKARKHWNQLSDTQKDEMYHGVVTFIEEYISAVSSVSSLGDNEAQIMQIMAFMRTFVNRYALVYAVMSCQYRMKHADTYNSDESITGGVELFINFGTELLMSDTQRNEAISDVNQLPHPGTLFMSLDLLAVLPAAVEDLDLSRPNKVQYDEQLIHFSALLFTCLEKLITARNHCFHNHEIISLLRLVRAWGSASGITLTRMADENHSLFVFILNCLNAAEDVQCMCEGALCVQELVTVNEYPRPGYRNSVVAMIMEAWAGLPPDDNEGVVDIGAFENSNLQYLLQSSEMDETVVNSICQSIISVAHSELDYIVSEEGFSPTFVSLLASLTALRPRMISLHTFEFWIALEDSNPSARHEYFRNDMFRLLTSILLRQMIHPDVRSEELSGGWGVGMVGNDSDSEDGGDNEDVEDMIEYRNDDQGIQDVLKLCAESLGSDMFFLLLDDYSKNAFRLFGENTSDIADTSKSNIATGPQDWHTLEVVMFTMVSTIDVIRHDAKVATEQSSIPNSISLLLKYLQHILSPLQGSSQQSYVDLYASLPAPFFLSCCKLLGGVTFLIAPPASNQLTINPPSDISPYILSPFQELFPASIEFFFYCLSSCGAWNVANSAAEGLLRLSTHGIHNIVNPHDVRCPISEILSGIVNSTATLLSPSPNNYVCRPVPIKSLLLVLQSVMVTIMSCPSFSHRAELLNTLVSPVLSQMEVNLASSSWKSEDFVRSLSILSQVIRYIYPSADNHDMSSESQSYIVDFLGQLWPLLEKITTLMARSEESADSQEVLDAVFALYKNAVTNMSSLLAQQPGVVQDMAERCITIFFSHRNSVAIDCAAGIVEAYPISSQLLIENENIVSMLERMLEQSIQGVGGNGFLALALDALTTAAAESTSRLLNEERQIMMQWQFTEENSSVSCFFNFMYQYCLSSPQILIRLSSRSNSTDHSFVDGLMQLLIVSLYLFHERDTIRKILSVIQAIYIPLLGGDALDAEEHNEYVTIPALNYSQILIELLLRVLDPRQDIGVDSDGNTFDNQQLLLQSGILPSLSDTLYTVLVVCDENEIPGVCEWLKSRIVSHEVDENNNIVKQNTGDGSLLLPSITAFGPEREIIYATMLRFVQGRTSRNFKALISDIHKVCNGEMVESSLRDYCS